MYQLYGVIEMSYELDGVKQIEAEELQELVKNKQEDVVLIDVREPEEYEAGHIPGVPLLPMQSIPSFIKGFQKDKEYVFICRSGNRSQKVSLFLQQYGIDKVTNFNGGMLSWEGDKKTGPETHLIEVDELKKLK